MVLPKWLAVDCSDAFYFLWENAQWPVVVVCGSGRLRRWEVVGGSGRWWVADGGRWTVDGGSGKR